MKMTTTSSQDTALQPMRNDFIDLTYRLATSCKEYFSQLNSDRLVAVGTQSACET